MLAGIGRCRKGDLKICAEQMRRATEAGNPLPPLAEKPRTSALAVRVLVGKLRSC
jgi:hypothetical protein